MGAHLGSFMFSIVSANRIRDCVPVAARTDLNKDKECGSRLGLGDRVWIDARINMNTHQSLIRIGHERDRSINDGLFCTSIATRKAETRRDELDRGRTQRVRWTNEGVTEVSCRRVSYRANCVYAYIEGAILHEMETE